MPGATSKLVKDLNSVPAIIGALGLNVAEAQKAFNLDYMDNLERLLGLISSLLAPKPADAGGGEVDLGENEEIIQNLLKQLAPSRYQFTETTLNVKMDLAQTMNLGASAGFSGGFGAVAVNAAMTVGFGYDYRAAAEVRSVLNAVPASNEIMTALLNRASSLNEKVLELPTGAQVDKDIVAKSHDILEKLVGAKAKPPEEKA